MAETSTKRVEATLPIVDLTGCFDPAVAVVPWPPGAAAALHAATAIDTTKRTAAAAAIDNACRTIGFFYIAGYPMPPGLEAALDAESRAFFGGVPLDEKNAIAMERGGPAWRGFFPVGGELTSGRPDVKEGIYFGSELPPSDSRVMARTPMHGANLFPQRPEGLRPAVVAYFAQCRAIGALLLELVAEGLGLPSRYFADGMCSDPLLLFRIFHYPPRTMLPAALQDPTLWGVGEHCDYGLLTLLKQDSVGGLEVVSRAAGGWIRADPVAGTLVVNIGDVLEVLTHGLYRSTPHRVRNPSADAMRLSFPFFCDPGFDAPLRPLPLSEAQLADAAAAREANARLGARWDHADILSQVVALPNYGAYILGKVAKCFPALFSQTTDGVRAVGGSATM